MVPPHSLRIPRARRYSGYKPPTRLFAYKTLTSFGWASHPIRLKSVVLMSVLTPYIFLCRVWPPPRSLAATYGIAFAFFSSAYLDVSVRRVPYIKLFIHFMPYGSSPYWFPNSDICGS